MFGDITVKSRPLRLAFLIPPTKNVLRKVIQINSTLWGGTYNPIIPLYAQSPKSWKQYPGEKIAVRERVRGYIRAFDPDVLVDCTGGKLPDYVKTPERLTIALDDIWEKFFGAGKDGSPRYGIGIFELLNAIYEEYFEVVRRFPSKLTLPTFAKEGALFWSAVVGELLPPIQEVVEKNCADALDIEKPAISAQNYGTFVRSRFILPRAVTRYKLESDGVGMRRQDSSAFYVDATKIADIVDYWNLRALGRAVIPIPKQFIQIPEYVEFVREFVREDYQARQDSRRTIIGTSIIRSFSSTMPELEAFARILQATPLIPEKPDAHSIALQHWYPRIWDEWAIGKDGATPDNIYSQTEEFSFPDVKDTVSFDLVKPKFVGDIISDSPRYANEIYPKFYGSDERILADVLPYDHGKEVVRVAAGTFLSGRDAFRISRTGLVHLVKWDRRVRWTLPLAEDVFVAWLKDKGFTTELSTCGRLAKQVHSQLGGWIGVLSNEPVIQLLDTMTKGGEDGKGAPLGEVKNRLANIGMRGNSLYQSLVDRKVFQLGYKTQCPHCGRGSWYDLRSLAAELICPLCHQRLAAISAVDSANKGAWHLKNAGPFSVEKFADGSYSVLLTLNFFQRDHSLRMTPIMSFTAKRATPAKELEADFALMWQDSAFGEEQEGMLFAECKSYNKFMKEDFDRMRTLAEQVPGAILAFSTLRKTLDASERKEIARIARAGMKRWKTERPINPVLVLTGHELFGFEGPPYCWKGLTVPDWAKNAHSILDICNATQSIHLGLPHWQELWHAEFEKRQKRRAKRKVQ